MNKDKLEERLAHPEQFYTSVWKVLEDEELSKDEKIAVLQSWKLDEEALSRATSENMGGGERPHIREADRALQTLTDEDAQT